MFRALLIATMLLVTVPAHAALTADLAADRTTCVAPCMVQFDARGTADTNSSYSEFLDHKYEFVFGEVAANPLYDATWGDAWGGDSFLGYFSKDRYTGAPLTAHVYETPGTYTARVTVTSPSGESSSDTLVIQVADPDDFFPGANTICYRANTGGTFAGCPVGADQRTTSSWTSIVSAVTGANKRALLRRGDTFQGSGAVAGAPSGVSNRVQFGAFGSGPLPIVSTGTDKSAILLQHNVTVMDIHLMGPTSNNLKSPLVGVSGCARAGSLLLRLKTTGGSGSVGWRCSATQRNQVSMVDSDFGDAANSTQGEGDKIVDGDYSNSAIMGNRFGRNPTSFIMRIWSNNELKVAFNKFNGSNNRSNIRFQAGGNAGGGDVPTEFFVFGYNTFGSQANNSWFAARPPSNTFYNIIRNYIIEGNFAGSSHDLSTGAVFGQNAAVRNNIYKKGGRHAAFVELDGKPLSSGGNQYPTGNIRLYRNTCFQTGSDADNPKPCFNIESTTSGDPSDVTGAVTLTENLMYAPNNTDPELYDPRHGLYTVGPGNVIIGKGATPFANADPSSILHYAQVPGFEGVGADPLSGIDPSTGGGGGSQEDPSPGPPAASRLLEVR